MHRPGIYDFTSEARTSLAVLIQQYVTPAIVAEHWQAAQAGAHTDPLMFLSFHRNYLAGLEAYLLQANQPEWVPLPAWDPATPVPPEFNIPSTGPDRLRNLNPMVSFSPQFDPPNLVNFNTERELGTALIPRHNLVHVNIGGVMNNVRRAPEAPVFWVFHSFIDDIWWAWQRRAVTVPTCVGLTCSRAQQLLGYHGLQAETVVPGRRQLSSWGMIRSQRPAPAARVTLGSQVKLYLE